MKPFSLVFSLVQLMLVHDVFFFSQLQSFKLTHASQQVKGCQIWFRTANQTETFETIFYWFSCRSTMSQFQFSLISALTLFVSCRFFRLWRVDKKYSARSLGHYTFYRIFRNQNAVVNMTRFRRAITQCSYFYTFRF